MFVRPRTALAAALACLLGFALTCLVAYLVPVAQVGDADALSGYVELAHNRSEAEAMATRIIHRSDPRPYAMVIVLLMLIALLRRRYRLAVLVPAVAVLAPMTTELLKHTLAHPREAEWLGSAQIMTGTWPSGHATASMTTALCAVLVAPQILRPLAALAGGAFALAVSFSMLMLHGHLPSDIVGGYLCAAMWTLLAVALLRRWQGPAPVRPRPLLTRAEALPAATFAVGTLAVGALVAIERPWQLLRYVADRPSFTLSAVAIAALAVLLATSLAGVAREQSSRW